MKINAEMAMKAPCEYLFQTIKNTFEQLESNPYFGKMYVFMNNVQHTIVNDKELALLLEPVDTCKQWCPVILEGQRRGEFREGNPNSLCVAIFGAIIILSFLIICGLPLGELTMGGQYKVFPKKLRIVLVVQLILQIFFVIIILQAGGIIPLWFSDNITKIICIIMAIYLSLNTADTCNSEGI